MYKSRDESEKLFKSDKTYLGNGAIRVQTDEAADAKIFIEFVALIIRNKIYTSLKDAVLEDESKSKLHERSGCNQRTGKDRDDPTDQWRIPA